MKDMEDYIQDQYDTMKNIELEHKTFRARLSALRQQIKEDTLAIRRLKAECHQQQVAGAGAPEQIRLARRFCGHPMKTHSESQCESPDWSDRGISMRQHCLCPGYPSVPELNREGTEVKFLANSSKSRCN